MKRAIFVLLFIIHAAPCLFSAEPIELEEIVVRPDQAVISAGAGQAGSPAQAVGRAEIEQDGPDSAPDVLNYVPGADLRYRGTNGIQADLSLRGSTFEQDSVSIDGIKLNDPQTGHYNLDLPLTVYDLAAVDVDKSGNSLIYGAGALAGAVNFRTTRPRRQYLKMDSIFGEHALFGQALSYGLPYKNFTSRVSLEHAISKAARPNTDFEYYTTSLYLNKDFDRSNVDSFFGYQKKDYGADSFYSNLFPEEEEHTETYFARTGLRARISRADLSNNLYIRRHRDKFILQRNKPTSVNYHTTYIYGLDSGVDYSLGQAVLSGKLSAGCDTINSTNLGKHSRTHEAASVGIDSPIGQRLNTGLGIRLDHYQKWGNIRSYNAGAEYDIVRDRLKLKGAYSRAFRLPTFTELYYSDAANRGDPDLKKETADNFTAGLYFREGGLDVSFEGFLRRGYDLIDYTRPTVNDIWQATNLGRVDFSGFEAGGRFNFSGRSKLFSLKEARLSYAYQTADRKAQGFLSKYALDILQNRAIFGLSARMMSLDLNLTLSYNQRYYGDTFITGDIYIGRKITNKTLSFEPFVRVDNFTDAEMTDVAGVLLPGRWVKSGLKFEW